MFTGIVVERGEVKKARERKGLLELEIACGALARSIAKGDSVSVSGVCLTARETHRRGFIADVIPETLARTTLGRLSRGDAVNLELAARLSDRLGGHLVQGHVDGVAQAIRVEDDEGARRIWFTVEPYLLDYMVPKGSIALDGVSLTLAEVGRTSFQVALIPHTLELTTLSRVAIGSAVNVEVDVIARYVEKLMGGDS